MKVLLAIDGTEQSDDAIKIVGSLDLNAIDEIRVLTVIDMALPLAHDIYSGMMTNTVEIEEAARKAAEASLEETVAQMTEMTAGTDTSITQTAVVGSPESQIVGESENINADLIIVGSHGYNRWERLLLGSVSDSVIHHAPCSVLVVRSRTDE